MRVDLIGDGLVLNGLIEEAEFFDHGFGPLDGAIFGGFVFGDGNFEKFDDGLLHGFDGFWRSVFGSWALEVAVRQIDLAGFIEDLGEFFGHGRFAEDDVAETCVALGEFGNELAQAALFGGDRAIEAEEGEPRAEGEDGGQGGA